VNIAPPTPAAPGRVDGSRAGFLDFEILATITSGCRGNPVHVACPACGPHRRASVNQRRRVLAVWRKPGFMSYTCARCGVHGWASERGAPHMDRRELEQQRPEHADQARTDAERNRRRALELWRQAVPIAGTLAADYLAARGILELPPDIDEVLRFHRRCAFGSERHPCLVALMRDAITDAPRAIQRTALTPAGAKLDRLTLGPKSDAAVKLWPDAEISQALVIGEGLETTLAAAMQIEHRGTLLRPAWAVADAGNLAAFPVMSGIEALTILVDHDASGTGQDAAQACAKRWLAAGREVIRLTPRQLNSDFNDVILATDVA
jgi:Toprim domain